VHVDDESNVFTVAFPATKPTFPIGNQAPTLPDPSTPIQGLKNYNTQYVPRMWEPDRVNVVHYVTLKDAEESARLLTPTENFDAFRGENPVPSLTPLKHTRDLELASDTLIQDPARRDP